MIEQTGAIRYDDQRRGVMALDLTPPLRFGRMKYSGKLRLWVSDCTINLCDFITFPTKHDAILHARTLGWTSSHVERIGSRFWSCWGIRYDIRDNYFLAKFE